MYVPAGVPVIGGVPPPPPQAASITTPAMSSAGRRIVRTRCAGAELIAAPISASNISVMSSRGRVLGQRIGAGAGVGANVGVEPRVPFVPGNNPAAVTRIAFALGAVVVTVSVLPVMVQVPSGITHAAVRVGVVVNPAVLSGKVKAAPGVPICVGCGTVTAGVAVNVAVATVFALIAKVQTALVLPAHAPAQLVNVAPELGTAVNVIEVPELKFVPEGDC